MKKKRGAERKPKKDQPTGTPQPQAPTGTGSTVKP